MDFGGVRFLMNIGSAKRRPRMRPLGSEERKWAAWGGGSAGMAGSAGAQKSAENGRGSDTP